ncbi:MAG: hypothetical protein HYZ86_02205 [Candidatus Omnitrophica bacterium]|nr:hypothetical protein [Candidatus Omnitrophota bacterium]
MVIFYMIVGVMFFAGALLGFLFCMLRKESVASVSIQPIMPSAMKEPGLQKHVEDLEEEMRLISEKAAAQAQEAMARIDTLTQENEKLKTEAQQGDKTRMAEAEQSLDRLREDNSSLQGQLEAGKANIKELQDEIVAVRKHMGDELLAANAEMTKLKAAPPSAGTAPVEEIEALHHEITKHRAQASGFERMCDNYKVQLEQALGRVAAMEKDQIELQAAKNRLEEVSREMEKQGQEFTKREKLSQFELEKTRSQLVALEKAYEEIKLKVKGPLPEGQPEGP